MRQIICVALCFMATAALACTVNVVHTPDGKQLSCVTCCDGNGFCTTNCQ